MIRFLIGLTSLLLALIVIAAGMIVWLFDGCED